LVILYDIELISFFNHLTLSFCERLLVVQLDIDIGHS
jgi:hypothetical protein